MRSNLRGGRRQYRFDALEVGDLGAHAGKVQLRPGLHLRTSLRADLDKSEQAANVFYGKADFAGAQDEELSPILENDTGGGQKPEYPIS